MSNGFENTDRTASAGSGVNDNHLQIQNYYDARVSSGRSPGPGPSHASAIRQLREQINWTQQLVISREHQNAAIVERTRYEAAIAGLQREVQILQERLDAEEKNAREWKGKYWALDDATKDARTQGVLLPDHHVEGGSDDQGGKHDEDSDSDSYWRQEYKKENAGRLACEAKCDVLKRRVTELEIEKVRTLTASKPEAVAAAEEIWRPKYEAMERKLDESRQQIEDRTRELREDRKMHEREKNDWASRKVQFETELDKKDTTVATLHQKYHTIEEELKATQKDLSQDKKSPAAEYFRKKAKLKRQIKELEFQVRENSIAVELLEMRLLEEEDANQMWRYKYVGAR
ncbi:hypothetical protein BJY00DRAFT_294753 [Aspergillus carlsbadensis]|nr:hypothetical protein BJY00DRAFT_294753 [Aspergillus carlsbadensis]